MVSSPLQGAHNILVHSRVGPLNLVLGYLEGHRTRYPVQCLVVTAERRVAFFPDIAKHPLHNTGRVQLRAEDATDGLAHRGRQLGRFQRRSTDQRTGFDGAFRDPHARYSFTATRLLCAARSKNSSTRAGLR